jgi:hypothetical protein
MLVNQERGGRRARRSPSDHDGHGPRPVILVLLPASPQAAADDAGQLTTSRSPPSTWAVASTATRCTLPALGAVMAAVFVAVTQAVEELVGTQP